MIKYTVSVGLRMEEEMLEELQKLAEREQRSVASMIRIAVEQMLRRDSGTGEHGFPNPSNEDFVDEEIEGALLRIGHSLDGLDRLAKILEPTETGESDD